MQVQSRQIFSQFTPMNSGGLPVAALPYFGEGAEHSFPSLGMGLRSAWKSLTALMDGWVSPSRKVAIGRVGVSAQVAHSVEAWGGFPSVGTQTAEAFEQRRVIVVTADPVERHRICWALDRAGFHVMDAATGAEAIELARWGSVDLMVIEVLRPGM